MLRQVLNVLDTLTTGLRILEKQGGLAEGGKQSYESYDGKHHYYGNAYYVGRKLIVIADRP